MYASSPEQSRRARVQALAAELHSERYDYLLRIARKHGAIVVDAEDAVQEAFVSFVAAFDPDSASPPLAWLTLTLERACWAARGRRSLIRVAPSGRDATDGHLTTGVADTEEAVERAERAREVGKRMARLKQAERRTLSLIGLGYTYNEIGEITGWSYAKVNRCAAEGRAALRKIPAG